MADGQCPVCGETRFENWGYCPACDHPYPDEGDDERDRDGDYDDED